MREIPREEWEGIYRKYLRGRGPEKPKDCAGNDEIASFFLPRTSRRKKYRLLHHILECESCRSEFEWIHELYLRTADLGQDVEKLKKESRPRFPLKGWVWAGAAAALISVILIVPAHRKSLPAGPVYRGAAQLQFRDIVPRQGADVLRTELRFGWKTPAAGGSFVFEIFDPAMALLWRSQATVETEIRIPEQVLGRLKDDQVYYWAISGTWDDQPIIESPLFSFRLVR
jgi:hypothetical protein